MLIVPPRYDDVPADAESASLAVLQPARGVQESKTRSAGECVSNPPEEVRVPVIPIDDADDPRIEPFRAVRDRDLAGRHGLFVAEGEVIVRALVSPRSRFAPASLLLSEVRARASSGWLEQLAPDLPIHVASQPVMDRIVGFPIHRGILAIARRGRDAEIADLVPPSPDPCLLLGLIGLANHDNVGAAFRNAAAFGADAVLLDGATCDPLYRKAVRVSAGTVLTTPFARSGTAVALLAILRGLAVEVFALGPAGDEAIGRVSWPARAALLLGAEGPGISPSLMTSLRSVRIEMAPGVDSLNVATAGAVALHAVRMQRSGF